MGVDRWSTSLTVREREFMTTEFHFSFTILATVKGMKVLADKDLWKWIMPCSAIGVMSFYRILKKKSGPIFLKNEITYIFDLVICFDFAHLFQMIKNSFITMLIRTFLLASQNKVNVYYIETNHSVS